MKKWIFIIFALIIGLTAIFLVPKHNDISNIVVNEENGDVAIHFSDDTTYIKCYVYDVEGNNLCKKRIHSPSGSTARVAFSDNCLNILVFREDAIYAFDREGKKTEPTLAASEIKNKYEWQGWQSSFGEKTYITDTHVYRYRYTAYPLSLFKFEAILIIEDISSGEQIEAFRFKG